MAHSELAPGIYGVGVLDWSMHDFHGFEAPRGVTYNSYLVVDEKIALIDGVKQGLIDELLQNISSLIDPAKIDYVIANHAEPDHSSGLARFLQVAAQATVVCTAKCRSAFDTYYRADWPYQIVKTGDCISLGKRTLQFIATPMVHWPDSMMTFVPGEKILFSMDIFGQHFPSTQPFDYQHPLGILIDEARSYYANIITPLGAVVLKALDTIESLDPRIIGSSHGTIWKEHIPEILRIYRKWASLKSDPKLVVIYDSMWDSTKLMARSIIDGAAESGLDARLIHLRRDGRTQAASEILEAAAIAVGSPTLLNRPMPEVAGFMSYIRGLAPVAPGKSDPRGKGRVALAFGSHGWAGGGAAGVAEELMDIGYEVIQPVICCVHRPDEGTLESCRQAGAQLAERARKLAGG